MGARACRHKGHIQPIITTGAAIIMDRPSSMPVTILLWQAHMNYLLVREGHGVITGIQLSIQYSVAGESTAFSALTADSPSLLQRPTIPCKTRVEQHVRIRSGSRNSFRPIPTVI